MDPYFQTHPIGLLYLGSILIWGALELRQYLRQRKWRESADKVTSRAFWPFFCAAIVMAVISLNASPHIVPSAEIGHGAAAFVVGMVILVAGITLRGWSFEVLGHYFTYNVKVSSDQKVITAGPYRLLRHPSYAAGLLIGFGIGILYGNWVGFAILTLLNLAIILWRINVEERALLTGLNTEYHAYAATRKRLVPLVW
jgi:protein-S-isoprenylcysteine O-methyltransferase Ste14